jgi:hypothetical protein
MAGTKPEKDDGTVGTLSKPVAKPGKPVKLPKKVTIAPTRLVKGPHKSKAAPTVPPKPEAISTPSKEKKERRVKERTKFTVDELIPAMQGLDDLKDEEEEDLIVDNLEATDGHGVSSSKVPKVALQVLTGKGNPQPNKTPNVL